MPPLEILYRLRKQHPEVFSKMEGNHALDKNDIARQLTTFLVYLDGGIRRGSDVLKALCLGATAVGLGRPFLYAQSVSPCVHLYPGMQTDMTLFQAYGAAGVVKIVRILEREIVMGMQLVGARTVKDLVPEMVSVA